MDCAEAKLQIEPYVTGEIPPDAKSALEEHLGACAECRLDVELTRASRNTPPDPAPETPPALVEPMDPGGADGTPAAARGAGEGPGAPAPSTAPGGESWTLDSIFGSGGSTKRPAVPPVFESHAEGAAGADAPSAGAPIENAPGPGAESPAPPIAASAQDTPFDVTESPKTVSPKKSLGLDVMPGAGAQEPPSRPASPPVFATSADEALPSLLTPKPPKKSDEPPPSDAPSWDFEPVEANGKAKPPEGSLFFAKEALSRGTPRKKGSPAARLALWAGGGVLGIGLLAASIWIALTMHPPLPPAVHGTQRTEGVEHGSEPGTPAAVPGVPADSTVTAGAAAGAASAPSSSAPAPSTAAPPAAPPTTPASSAAATAPSSGPATAPDAAARNVSPAPTTDGEAPAHTRAVAKAPVAKTGTGANHGEHGTKVAKTMSKSEALARADTSAKNGAHGLTSKRGGEAATRTQAPHADSRATTTPSVPKTTESAPTPPSETSRPAESAGSETGSSESAPTTPETTPKPASPAPDAATAPSGTASPEESVERPIDRLHLATLAAEQNADLPGLRKMRDTWHGFVKTSLGPDRARAKRELADCLWAIQTLTSKTSDQKEALAAYRDYVLNAPAGGADARTVARMRQLEDALTESR